MREHGIDAIRSGPAQIDVPNNRVSVGISRKGFDRFQFGAVSLFVVLGSLHYAYDGIFGDDFVTKLTRIFDVNREESIPTVFSVYNLLMSSTLLFAIYLSSKKRRESISAYWLILSVIFLGLSIDEGAALHERAQGLGVFSTWIVYGVLFSLAVFLFFIPFLRQIDRRMAILFLLSGAIFVTGAAGLEYFGGWRAHGQTDFIHQTIRILKESFEMYGIALFNCTLFAHISANNIVLSFSSKAQTSERNELITG